jgi:hypothetical protein
MNPSEITTDTPRTDAVPPEFDGITNNRVIRALRIFGRETLTKDGSLESWINLAADRLEKAEAEADRLEKAEAEVERLKKPERKWCAYCGVWGDHHRDIA